MIPVDIGHVYPKTGLDADLRFDKTPLFISTGSLALDGSNDRLDCDGAQWASTGAWTIACWVKCLGTSTSAHHLMSATDGSNTFDLYISGGSSGNINLHDGNSGQNIASNAPLFDGTWHHFAITCGAGGGATATLYFDGQVQGTITVTCDDLSSASTLHIGSNTSGGSCFKGQISNFGIWESTLSQASIRSLMLATSYTEVISKSGATPKEFWVLDTDGDASVGQNGTLTNGAVITGDRCRLPNGFDLTGNRLDARAISGRAFSFDATGSDGLRGTTTFDINGSGDTTTLSCWFNADSLSGTNTTIVGNTKSNASNNFAIYRTGTNEIAAIAFYASSTHVKVSTGSVLQSGKWYHVAATFDRDSTTIKLYVNGKEYSASPSLSYGGSENTFEIGYRYNSGSPLQAFSGKIAHVKMFDIAFSAAQALEQYKDPEQILPTGVSASNLKRWYPLSDYDKPGAGNLNGLYAQDCSGNGKHLIADNCGMSFAEHAPCPQLGLQSSSSRMLIQDDELVTISSSTSLNVFSGADGGGSVAFWIFVNSDGESDHGRVLFKNGKYELITRNESGGTCELQFEVPGFSGGTAVHRSAKSIAIGAWTHVVMTYTGLHNANPIFYINGSPTTNAADTQTTGTFTDSGDLVLGNKADGSRSMDGILSEVALWSSILDADAVTVLYNSGAQGFDPTSDLGNYDVSSDLTALYSLDNPVTIEDLSTNSNTGTVSGSPNMVTIPEGTTADRSVCGTLTQRYNQHVFSGMPLIPGAVANGGALQFTPFQFGTDNFTIHFWYKISHAHWGGAANARLLHSAGSTGYINFLAYKTNAYWCVCQGASGLINLPNLQPGTHSIAGEWVQICIRREAAALVSFHSRTLGGTVGLDNNDNSTVNIGAFNLDSPFGLRFGAGHNDTNPYNNASGASFCGVRIYKGTAITDAQVNELFEADARILRSL